MGVNMAGNCIIDDDVVLMASKKEILRRHCNYLVQQKNNKNVASELYKIELIMKQLNISTDDRPVVSTALNISEKTNAPVTAIELHDGRIITGKATELLENVSAMLLNALKEITSIPDEIHLLAPEVIGPVRELKCQYLSRTYKKLNVNEILIALSISAHTSATAAYVLKHLPDLAGCDIHSTVMLSSADIEVLKKLGLNVTSEPKYQIKEIFIG
jgi:uncharacterized protein (UPF0371 family)